MNVGGLPGSPALGAWADRLASCLDGATIDSFESHSWQSATFRGRKDKAVFRLPPATMPWLGHMMANPNALDSPGTITADIVVTVVETLPCSVLAEVQAIFVDED